MTIEEVMATVVDYRIAVFQGDDAITESALRTVRNAAQALVAQARDEEAAACIGIIVGANNYDNPLTGNDCIDMIRARIAARKGGA